LLRPLLTSRSVGSRCPFRHKARSPRVRTHSFTAQPPDIRYVALATRASRLLARSPCLAAPPIRFLFIGSRFTLHASFPRLVTLPQLRFASFAVASLREDLHLQECARAGRTKKGRQAAPNIGQRECYFKKRLLKVFAIHLVQFTDYSATETEYTNHKDDAENNANPIPQRRLRQDMLQADHNTCAH
ncbi:hypothetical protein SAMN04487867_1451, partial [Vreelandella titanicae]